MLDDYTPLSLKKTNLPERKNILILGAAGFIGNACYEYFSKRNTVTGIDITENSKKPLIYDPDFSLTPKIIKEQAIDIIINCAGSANVSGSFKFAEKDRLSNVTYVENILSVLQEYSKKTKFINISSAAVYGNPSTLPISENALINPLSPYGVHKHASETLMREFSEKHELKTLSVRIFSAYGTGLRRQFFHDLYSKLIMNKPEITLFGTGNESRDFIFISDIVEALEVVISKGNFIGDVYNLASGEETFIKDCATVMADILKYSGKINFTNEQLEGYPLNWRADIGKLKALGFSPKTNLKAGLLLYVNWIKNNPA